MDKIINRLVRRLGFLSEAGRVLSSKNESRIRSAADELTAVLAELGTTDVAEAERTYYKRIQVLDDAVRSQFRTQTTWCSLMDVFDTSLVYSLTQRSPESGYYGDGERTLYQVDYTINDDDSVTFGTSVEVVARTVYEPIGEAMMESGSGDIQGDVIPLIERAIKPDGTTTVKVIAPGWGSSGYYSADVLERDGPAVFPAGTHMYLDHPTERELRELPERSVERLAAVTTTPAQWRADHPAGPGLYAEAKVKAGRQQDLNDIADHIGVSIIASGTYDVGEAEGKKGRIIRSLTNGQSIDFVTRAGAGGKLISMMESWRGQTVAPPVEDAMTEQEAKELRERMQRLEEDNARLREAEVLRTGRSVVQQALAGHPGLHQMTRTRLEESLAARVVIADGAVDVAATQALVETAVQAEQDYLAKLNPTGVIRGVGAPLNEGATPEQTEANLSSAFQRLGLNESAATVAAKGR